MSDDIDLSNKFVFRLNDHGQGPELLRQVFLERGWVEFDEETQDEDDWNMWWRTSRFRNSDYDLLRGYQQVNHYPRSTAITKKDSLARNLKRMRGVYGPSVYNFSPLAFNLPNDYRKFVAEYTRLKEKNSGKDLCWICKPADLSRGRGIFIFRNLSDLQYDCNAVIQQYLMNPLLISGYKFDLRIYVMVPSFHPLNIYMYQEGLVRFSTEKFNLNALGNLFSHLTNTSINKYSPSYTADKERVGPGCKWTITQLRHYFRQCNIDDDILWRKIINIIILTLVLQANQVPKVTNCFELYGFDVIIDDQLKPWLLEVNFSPALSSDCQTDLQVKKPMLHDLMDFLNFQDKDQQRGYSTRPSAGGMAVVAAAERRGQARTTIGGRLPHIAASSSHSLMNHNRDDLAEEDEDEVVYSRSDQGDVVPVIPGCGLPSVQQPAVQTWRSGVNNINSSSRGSSASSRKSLDLAESQSSSDWRSSTSSIRRHGLKRTDSKSSSQFAPIASPEVLRDQLSPQQQQLLKTKRESKVSIQSDSGVSSYSGSSDNSDNPQSEEQGHNGARAGAFSRKLSGPKKLQETNNNLTRLKPTDSRNSQPEQSHSSPLASKSVASVTNTGLMNRYALTDHVPDAFKTNPSTSTTATVITSANRQTLPRGTRSSALRTSMHADGKKKYGQFGYPANPLLQKSGLLNRRGSLNNMFNAPKLANNYAKPWRRGGGGSSSLTTDVTPKTTTNPLRHRVGDFYLAYPFNEATRKCSAGNQDVKVVIRETQKLAKEFQATNTLKAPLFDLLPLWQGLHGEAPSS